MLLFHYIKNTIIITLPPPPANIKIRIKTKNSPIDVLVNIYTKKYPINAAIKPEGRIKKSPNKNPIIQEIIIFIPFLFKINGIRKGTIIILKAKIITVLAVANKAISIINNMPKPITRKNKINKIFPLSDKLLNK